MLGRGAHLSLTESRWVGWLLTAMSYGSKETRTTTSRRGEGRGEGRDEGHHTPEDPAAQPGTLSLPDFASRLCPRPKARDARPLLPGLWRAARQEVICSPPKSACSLLLQASTSDTWSWILSYWRYLD